MAITQSQKVDYLWKKIGFGKAKTDVNSQKTAINESISSPLLLRGSEVWAESGDIPTVMPSTSGGVVTVYPTTAPDETTADGTATANRTWLTGLTDWIPPEIGSTYNVKVYLHTAGDAANAASSGTQVFGAGSGNDDEWYFDYQAGVLNFIGENLPSGISGKVAYISGARYTGTKGVAPASGGDFTGVNLNVTGIATLNQTTTNDLVVSAGATITGALEVDGGATFNSAIVEDLTEGRVVLAGTGGELEDSANLTFGANGLVVTGEATVSAGMTVTGALDVDGGADISGGETVLSSATISDLTETRVPIVGTSGSVEDSANLTYTDDRLNVVASGLNATEVNASGIVTATAFHTGASGSAMQLTSNTLSGPSEFILDPAPVGDNGGSVRVRGDLYVDGDAFVVSSGTIELGDFNVGIATTVANNELLNGAGWSIGADSIKKTLVWNNGSTSLKSSEDWNLASGKVYKVNDVEVLSETNLASGIGVSAVSLDIDGAEDIGGNIDDGDLFIVDDGGNGTNRKTEASRLKAYVLGGSAGAQFTNIEATGIATFNQTLLTTLNVSAGATITGPLDANGGADISGGNGLIVTGGATVSAGLTVTGAIDANGGADISGGAVIDTLAVSDLTDGRVLLAGASGELEDSANLTFGDNGLTVTGEAVVSAGMTVSGAFNANSLGIDGTQVVSSARQLQNIASLDAVTTATIEAAIIGAPNTFDNLLVTGISTFQDAIDATTINATGVGTFADIRNSDGGLLPLVGVHTASADAGIVTAFKFRGGGLEDFIVSNGVADIVLSGVAATTFTTSELTVATEGQTTFTFSAGYSLGFLDVYINGVRLVTGTDYTATNGSTFDLTTGAAAGDEIEAVGWKSLGDVVTLTTLETTQGLIVGGIATAQSFNGALNFTGVSTAGQLQTTDVNATGIITASKFVGSGAGLSDGTVPIISLDIDGGTDIGEGLADGDLFIVDDGADGTNRFTTAARIRNYVLGSGSASGADANFGSINVTGIATVTFAKADTLTVSAGATITGALDVDGGADIAGGAVIDTLAVSDLTDGRVVLAGASGELEDSANLTFGDNGLTVTGGSIVSAAATFSDNLDIGGNAIITGDLTVNGTTTQINTVNTTIEDVLLELQVVDGSAPSSDTNKDVGVVMNYFTDSAKKAAVFWDDSEGRFAMASEATETSGVLGSLTYGGLEIGSLFLNDCAGASQVISCSGTTRSLENISIDGGSF